jgi:putative nucleotidyltransferase with HDIG domain
MLRQSVPSGSFEISHKKIEILEAYLGSCVGVAISDPHANVGGLIHILLPEPSGTDVPYQPATYASSGFPLFLEALKDAGARKEEMRAVIAGGALVGGPSELDLILDIGGRTAESVQTILRREGIHVSTTETGGFFGRRLTLNLHSWESRIEPLFDRGAEGNSDFRKPSPEEIDETICKVKPIPQIALKIIRMIRQDEYRLGDISSEIRQDQVISAKVIHLCNTALIGLRKKVDSIERALIVLGEKKLLQLVISASVQSLFSEATMGYSLCKGGMFQHAVGTGVVAQELAAFTGRSPIDLAYTAGLLHDIGKVPLDQYMTTEAPFFYLAANTEASDFSLLEKERFGISHTEAGARMGERWLLPDNLVDVIRHHHYPEQATVDQELTTLVFIADLLMSKFQAGNELEKLDTARLTPSLTRLGLAPQHLPVIVDRIPKSVFGASPPDGVSCF